MFPARGVLLRADLATSIKLRGMILGMGRKETL